MNKLYYQIKNSKINNYTYPSAKRHYALYKKLENEFNITLEKDLFYIVRFDGKGMTKDYKLKDHTMDTKFYKVMKETFKTFCKNHDNILFAYSYSDEISILIKGNSNSIHSRLEKILSLYSSELSVSFYKTALENKLEIKSSIFDARLIKIEKEKIVKYFCLRQEYAICDFLQQLRDKHEIGYTIIKTKDIIARLEKKNVDYYCYPAGHRFGIVYSPLKNIIPFEFSKNTIFLEKSIQEAIQCKMAENH